MPLTPKAEEIIGKYDESDIVSAIKSIYGKRQTPHGGGGRSPKETPCPKCGRLRKSAALAKKHCR